MTMTTEQISCFSAVIISGAMGAVLLYIAKGYLAQVTEEHVNSSATENTDEEPVGLQEEHEKNRHWGNRKGFLATASLLLTVLCAIAGTFMLLLYDDSPWIIWSALLLLPVLWACAYADREAMIIPNKILLIGLVMRLLLLGVMAILRPTDFLPELINSVVAGAGLLCLSLLCRFISRGAIGYGDIKLLALMGLYLGLARIWGCLLISMICGFCYSLFLLITKRATRKTEISFAPILLLGTFLSFILTGT